MKLFTLRLFCCYFCYRFSFSSFFFVGQLDNSICALSHVQWNVAPTSQTDLSGLYTIRVYFFFFSFFLSFSFSRTTFSLIRRGCTPYCVCNYWRYHSCSVSWFFRIVHFSFRLFVPEGQRWAASESRLSVSQSVRCLVRVCVCSVKEFVCLVWLHLRTGKGHFIQQYTDWEAVVHCIWRATRDKTVTIPAGWRDLKFRCRMNVYCLHAS